MGRPKKVKNDIAPEVSRSVVRRIAAQKGEPAPDFSEEDKKVTDLRLQRLKIERIYYPEDFPQDCPDPRDAPDAFILWAKRYYKLT